jgi:hypothetical protein
VSFRYGIIEISCVFTHPLAFMKNGIGIAYISYHKTRRLELNNGTQQRIAVATQLASLDYDFEQAQNEKRMQAIELSVFFDKCLFENNTSPSDGVLISTDSDLVSISIRNSTFYNNDVSQELQPVRELTCCLKIGIRQAPGAIVTVSDAVVQLEGNCFVNNTFRGDAPVMLQGKTTKRWISGNFGIANSGEGKCQFVCLEDSCCIDYDLSSCPHENHYVLRTLRTISSTPTRWHRCVVWCGVVLFMLVAQHVA